MIKKPEIFIQHILESIQDIEKYLLNVGQDSFLKDKKLQDAVVRRIEIIGEAVKNIPNPFRKKYPNVPWKDIAGMRDKIVHHYFGVDF